MKKKKKEPTKNFIDQQHKAKGERIHLRYT